MEDELDFEKWESAIGKLILACSRVEYELIRLYEKWLPDRTYHEDDYLSRFDKAIGVAKRSLENGDNISELLIHMKKAANFRHLVAHNPIHYSSETDDFHIFDLKNNEDSVCVNELLSIAESVGIISIELTVQLRINV